MTLTTGTLTAIGSPTGRTSIPPGILGRHFMLRVAGLPIEAADGLRCPRTVSWAESVVEADDLLRGRAKQVGDLLHEAIGEVEAGADRHALVSLRRDIFGSRLPRDLPAALRLVDQLGGAAGQAAGSWLRDLDHVDALRHEGSALLAAEIGDARARLRELAVDPRLRQGLLLASPGLDQYLDSYTTVATGGLTKRQRRLERSLLEYVYRAACKTSPFSSFTGVALGEFTGTDAPARSPLAATVAGTWTATQRINVAILGRLAALIVDNAMLRADLPVAITSGWAMDVDRIRYVRREVSAGDSEATVSFDAVRESLFFLRASGTLQRMVAVLEATPGISYRNLVAALAGDDPATAAEYDRYLGILLRLGLLQVPVLQLDIHSRDPLRSFRAALVDLGHPWASAAAAQLDGPIAAIDKYARADVPARRELLARIRRDLTALAEELGGPSAKLPAALLFEDCRAAEATVTVDREFWSAHIGDSLRSLSRMFPAFDLMLPHRLTLKGFFVSRYGQGGRCDSLLTLVQDFHEDIYDQYVRISAGQRPFDAAGEFSEQENWLALPEIGAMDRARRRFVDGMRELWAAGPSADGCLEIGEGLLSDVAAELGPSPHLFSPRSHFVQMAGTDTEPVAVLNRSYGGLSFPFSRFVHCLDDSTDGDLARELRIAIRELQPPGAVFAEVTGGFATTNLNLHPRLTDFEIVCPGENPSVPPECRIPLDDLHVIHDVAQDRLMLRSDRLDREVIPVYLGYLLPMALPEIPQTLLLFSPVSMAAPDVWGGVPAPAGEDVVRRPRVRHGKVVVARQSWSAPVSALPQRVPAMTEADWYLTWRRWKRQYEVPDRTFATIHKADPDGGDDGGWAGASKPLYVDFDSQLSMTVLDNLIKTGVSRVVFREMLPGEGSLWVTSTHGRHVAEMVVELTTSTVPLGNGRPDARVADQPRGDLT
jgi:Lantibiotic dehydratase, N terminus